MEEKYQKYYDALRDNKLVENSSKLSEEIQTSFNKLKEAAQKIDSSTWDELGVKEMKINTIPKLSSAVETVQKNINDSLKQVCTTLNDEVLQNLIQLKSDQEKYDNLNSEEHKEEKQSLLNAINNRKQVIDNSISKINSITVIDMEKEIESSTPKEFVGSNDENLSKEEIERLRQEFIGDIDNDNYTVASNAGKKAQVQRLFYNGKELKDGDEIVIKKGETIRITVKLPTTAGQTQLLKRTSADGYHGDCDIVGQRYWERYFSAHSEPFVNRNDSSTYLHRNNYDWVITGNNVTKGYVTLSQTSFQKTDKFNEIKSMVTVRVKVVDA